FILVPKGYPHGYGRISVLLVSEICRCRANLGFMYGSNCHPRQACCAAEGYARALEDSMDSRDRPKFQTGNKEGVTTRLVRTRPPGMAVRFGLSWSLLR